MNMYDSWCCFWFFWWCIEEAGWESQWSTVTHTRTHIHTKTHTHKHTHTHTHTQMHAHTHTHSLSHAHTHTHTHMTMDCIYLIHYFVHFLCVLFRFNFCWIYSAVRGRWQQVPNWLESSVIYCFFSIWLSTIYLFIIVSREVGFIISILFYLIMYDLFCPLLYLGKYDSFSSCIKWSVVVLSEVWLYLVKCGCI